MRMRPDLLDKNRKYYFLLLGFAVLISRLPQLNLGFGLDFDAWHMAVTAFDVKNSFLYHTSRFPGFPLPEFFFSAVIDFGWIGTNLLTLCITVAGAYYFDRILAGETLKFKEFIVPAYLFNHLIWINSSNSMDYIWSLSFILIALYFLFKERYITAGIMFGFAVGSRITSGLFLLPFMYVMYTQRSSIHGYLRFISASAVTALTLFVPLFITYGMEFLTYYGGDVELFFLFERFVAYFGIWTLIIAVPLVLVSLVLVIRKIHDGSPLFNLSVMSSFLVIALFLYKPYEKEYILPAIPFILLICCSIFKRYSLIIFTAMILANIHYIPLNINQRNAQLAYAYNLIEKDFPENSVVLLGSWFPVFSYLNENVTLVEGKRIIGEENRIDNAVCDYERSITYRYILSEQELESLLNNGQSVFFVNSANDITLSYYKFDLNNTGAVNIDHQ